VVASLLVAAYTICSSNLLPLVFVIFLTSVCS
jgi:hypothetical protein